MRYTRPVLKYVVRHRTHRAKHSTHAFACELHTQEDMTHVPDKSDVSTVVRYTPCVQRHVLRGTKGHVARYRTSMCLRGGLHASASAQETDGDMAHVRATWYVTRVMTCADGARQRDMTHVRRKSDVTSVVRYTPCLLRHVLREHEKANLARHRESICVRGSREAHISHSGCDRARACRV